MTAPTDPVERDLPTLFGRMIEGECTHGHMLARYAADDLPEAERLAFESTLAGCPHCRQDLERYRTTDFSPGEGVVCSGRVRWWGLRLAAVATGVVVCCLAIWLGLRPKDDLRFKGSFQLQVGAAREGRQFPVTETTRLRPGDQLGFFYSSARAGHLVIYYAGPEGDVQLLVPASAAQSLPIAAGQNIRLVDGAEVSPGDACAWILAVYSDKPFVLAPVEDLIRAAAQGGSPCAPDWSGVGRTALVEQGFDLIILRLWLQ